MDAWPMMTEGKRDEQSRQKKRKRKITVAHIQMQRCAWWVLHSLHFTKPHMNNTISFFSVIVYDHTLVTDLHSISSKVALLLHFFLFLYFPKSPSITLTLPLSPRSLRASMVPWTGAWISRRAFSCICRQSRSPAFRHRAGLPSVVLRVYLHF